LILSSNPELSANPKRFWEFIKSKKCEPVGVSPVKDSYGLACSDSEKKVSISKTANFPQFLRAMRILKPSLIKGRGHTHACIILMLLKMVS
jgi:hypothetical protein